MSYELVVGLQVDDQSLYSEYRSEIKPLLDEVGGGFQYDFEVARTLANSSGHAINRVFVLAFPDKEAKERFFADFRYRGIRARLFEKSVGGTSILAEGPR